MNSFSSSVSLEELCLLLGSQNDVEPVSNVALKDNHGLRRRLTRRVEITTVAAGIAGRELGDLAQEIAVLLLGGDLPGVFTAVGEENVRALGVPATLVSPR